MNHTKDADCTVGADGLCSHCGVIRDGYKCIYCNQEAYHLTWCPHMRHGAPPERPTEAPDLIGAVLESHTFYVTTAPPSYDYGPTIWIFDTYMPIDGETPARCVAIQNERASYQIGRYQSGLYAVRLIPEDWWNTYEPMIREELARRVYGCTPDARSQFPWEDMS